MSASLVTVVSLYGQKQGALRRLLESVQSALASRLGTAFRPYPLEQVHGTLVIVSGLRDAAAPGAVLNQYFLEHRGVRRAMDFDRVQQLLCSHLARPLTIRIGGFGPQDPTPFTSRGQHLHERSFSASGGALVLMGWPAASLRSAGTRRPLDDLRRAMTEAGVLHRYHVAPTDVDDDFHLVVGHYADATPDSVQAAVRAIRQQLAQRHVEIEVGLDQVRIIASDSPTLAAPRFNAALPLAASEFARLYDA
jgi:hypothetical protein